MSIKNYIDELENVNKEIAANKKRNATLRKRVKTLEAYIASYLESNEQIGLKYNGKAIIMKQTKRRVRKKVKEKKADVMNVLNSLGISNPDYVYTMVMKAQQGERVDDAKISIHDL